MKHDSRSWTPLLFFVPIGLFCIGQNVEYTSLRDWSLFQVFMVLSFVWALLAQFDGVKPDWSSPRDRRVIETEQAYLIRVNKNINVNDGSTIRKGYPMTVGRDACEKALATGDYDYEGVATEAAGFYFNDGYIPGGHIEAGAHYRDERLN